MSSIGITRPARRAGGLALALLATELVDELIDGATSAAWPAIRGDLALDYSQVGLLLAVPAVIGHLIEPAIFLAADAGDRRHRRRLILGGGAIFTLSVLLYAAAGSFAGLLVAFTLFSPASGAFVSLSQATLMDLDPRRHAQSMARWTLAGSIGGVGGAALVAAAERFGPGWRGAIVVIAVLGAVALASVARMSRGGIRASEAPRRTRVAGSLAALGVAGAARQALRALRDRDILRWIVLLECSNLMLDILHGFLALYFVDVVGVSMSEAALAVAVWVGVGLLGDALLIPLLERVNGVRYLRASAALTAVGFVAFLLVPGFVPRLAIAGALGLLNSGWYAILQAGLYSAMPGRSATALALGNVGGIVGSLMPLGIGLVAERAGLGAAMWLLLAGPLALLVGLPRAPGAGRGLPANAA